MDDPVEHGGTWWRHGDDGGWLRWDPLAHAWMPSATVPAGDQAAPPPPAPLAPFAPLDGHMRWAVGFLVAAVAFDVIAVLSGFQQFLFVERVADGAVTTEEIRDNDARQALVGLLQVGLLIVAGVAFLRWFRRAYSNVPGLLSPRTHGEGWAVGAWFVPLLNLVRPKRIADELWRSSEPEGEPGRVPVYLHVWWAAWLLTHIVGYLASTTLVDAEDIGTVRVAAGWIVVADILAVLAGLLLIRFVQDVTMRQRARRAALEGAPGNLND